MSKLRAVFHAIVCTCFYLYNNNLINTMEKFVIFAFRQDKNHTKKLYFIYADFCDLVFVYRLQMHFI